VLGYLYIRQKKKGGLVFLFIENEHLAYTAQKPKMSSGMSICHTVAFFLSELNCRCSDDSKGVVSCANTTVILFFSID
jgi:hypothetical protein